MRIPAMLLALACAATLLPLAFAPVGSAEVVAEPFIQPGRGVIVKDPDLGLSSYKLACSLGFVLKDAAGRHYATTAGHCDFTDGNPSHPDYGAYHPTYGRWGDFVWSDYVRVGNDIVTDVALIRVYDNFQLNVDPSVHFWGGPTGVLPVATLQHGDLVAHSGFPGPANPYSSMVGQARTGPIGFHNATMWTCECVISGGDSGSAFIDVETGRALGILSGGMGDGTFGGANFALELARIQAAGWSDLTLATAPYVPQA